MLFFLALSALAAASFGSVVIYQRGEKRRLAAGGVADPRLLLAEKNAARVKVKSAATTTALEPTLETLTQGDVVVDGDDDWLVTGTVAYREENDRWAMHALDGGARSRFLEVRARGGILDVAFIDLVDGLPAGQLLQGLTFRGQSFNLDGRGDARTSVDGDVGTRVSSGGVLA